MVCKLKNELQNLGDNMDKMAADRKEDRSFKRGINKASAEPFNMDYTLANV